MWRLPEVITPQALKQGGVLRANDKRQIDSLLSAVARAPQSLLMLDYDGTLAPFHQDPKQAFPHPGFSPLLQQIVNSGRTRLIIISGRDANELIPLLNISPRPELWGLHGLQRLKTDGGVELSPMDPATLSTLEAAEEWLRYQHLEHTAEFKTGSIAVHWRGLDECDAEGIRGRVLMGWTPLAKYTPLDLLEFDGGVEIRAHNSDKGDVIRTILSEVASDAPAVYLADDTTDEQAFQVLNGRGLSVLVRPRWRRTAAPVWFIPPDDVFSFLSGWLLACQERDLLRNENDTSVEVNV
jgi:trehalose 6-phosphate phosphatase